MQKEFTDTLAIVGRWMQLYGSSIYGTRGSIFPPQEWGVVTGTSKNYYVHILNKNKLQQPYVFIPGLKEKILSAALLSNKTNIKFRQQPEGLFIYIDGVQLDDVDTIIQLNLN